MDEVLRGKDFKMCILVQKIRNIRSVSVEKSFQTLRKMDLKRKDPYFIAADTAKKKPSLFQTKKNFFCRFSQSKNSIFAHPLVKITRVKIIMAMHLRQKSCKILSIVHYTVMGIMHERISFNLGFGVFHAHDCNF